MPSAAPQLLTAEALPSASRLESGAAHVAPAPASATRPVALARRLLFAGCTPEPRWCAALGRRGIQVVTTSLEQAASCLAEQPPACLVLDADVDLGHAALRAELEHGPWRGPVALLASAPALFAAMVEWRPHGAAHVLLKPAELDELLALVEPATATPPTPRLPSLERLQREYIRAVLISCEGNVSEAARQLGMYRQSLQRMLRRHPPAR